MSLLKGCITADINYAPALDAPIPTSEWKKRYLGTGDEHTRSMIIRDVRHSDQDLELDTHGFTFVKLPSKQRVDDSSSEELIRQEYYHEVEALVKSLTGASAAFVFNHVVRAHSSPSDKGKLDAYGRWQDVPSGHPHVDYCGEPAALEGTRQELNLPPQVSALFDTSSRYAYLGAWRPLNIVRRDPLAVCDATTVPDSDYRIRLREFRSGVKSGNYVMCHAKEQQQHKWYYMSEMTPDEIVVFKGHDTDQTLHKATSIKFKRSRGSVAHYAQTGKLTTGPLLLRLWVNVDLLRKVLVNGNEGGKTSRSEQVDANYRLDIQKGTNSYYDSCASPGDWSKEL